MIVKLKNRRHRPLYKKFVLLRKNVQNRRKLNLFKLKRKKWNNLILYLKRVQLRRKKRFAMYDFNRHFLPKFSNLFKRKHNYTLNTVRKFKLFYGGLPKKYLKNQVQLTLRSRNCNLNSFFIQKLESRLDVILYRSHFASTMRLAKQLIKHKHILVNNNIVQDSSYLLKKGDLIEIKACGLQSVEFNLQNSHIWPLPPKYLNINYKTLQIIYNASLIDHHSSLSILFPFLLDISTVIKYYKTIFSSSVVEQMAVNR